MKVQRRGFIDFAPLVTYLRGQKVRAGANPYLVNAVPIIERALILCESGLREPYDDSLGFRIGTQIVIDRGQVAGQDLTEWLLQEITDHVTAYSFANEFVVH